MTKLENTSTPCLKSQRPRYILVSDFQTFELHDLDERETATFTLSDLTAHVEKFGFILGVQRQLGVELVALFANARYLVDKREQIPKNRPNAIRESHRCETQRPSPAGSQANRPSVVHDGLIPGIPDTLENVARALVKAPPKKSHEWKFLKRENNSPKVEID